jgi:hypothetical protein
MRAAALDVTGTLDELLGQADVVVDCTPKRIAAKNIDIYRRRLKFVVQCGERHEATGHSFVAVAEANYATALDRDATRVVSCNTTSIVRTLTALKCNGVLQRARGTLLRRGTDPWESHESGIMNTLVESTWGGPVVLQPQGQVGRGTQELVKCGHPPSLSGRAGVTVEATNLWPRARAATPREAPKTHRRAISTARILNVLSRVCPECVGLSLRDQTIFRSNLTKAAV